MAKRKLPGLYWDHETGKGRVEKRIDGIGSIRKRFTASSWAEAEVEYHRIIADAKNEKTISMSRIFREASVKYLIEETKRSLSRDADALERLDPWIGKLRLDHIHQGTLQPYIDHRKECGVKSATVCRELAVVRRILTLSARVWRDSDNRPWLMTPPLLRMPDWSDQAKPYPLNWEEQRRLFNLMPTHLAEMCLFAVNTGARENIITQLRWSWEHRIPELITSVFLVPGEWDDDGEMRSTKNGTDCLIVLNDAAKSVIETRRFERNSDFVFTFRGNPVDRINNNGWRRAWRDAGLPVGDRVLHGPHNLRHTFARRLRMAGVPLETRRALMHHIDGDITIHYSPAELRELIEAVQKIKNTEVVTMLRSVG
jgi:integrase